MRGVKLNVEVRNKIVASFTTDECPKIDDHLFVTLPADDYLREMSRKSLEEAEQKIKEYRANNCGEDELSYFIGSKGIYLQWVFRQRVLSLCRWSVLCLCANLILYHSDSLQQTKSTTNVILEP